MLLNCGVGEDFESPLDCEEIQPVHPKGDQSWVFIGGTGAEAETPILWPPHAELTHWKWPWCWERLKGGGEGDNRGWDGWMVSLTQWIWVWTSSGSWWWTGKPGVLQSMGMQSARHDWATMLNWTDRYLRRRQNKEQKKLFEEIIAEKSPNLEKKTHSGPRSRVPNKIT